MPLAKSTQSGKINRGEDGSTPIDGGFFDKFERESRTYINLNEFCNAHALGSYVSFQG
jgi:hypothetical protein